MNAKLIVAVDGMLVESCVVTLENILPAFEVRGFEFSHINDNPRQRYELQGWPVFSGLLGPMWNGDSVRYESEAAYNICSA